MKTLALPAQTLPDLSPRRIFRDDPIFAGLALVLALMVLPTLLAMAIDTRIVQGESPWIKPLKFELALAAYFGTLAVYARWLPDAVRQSRWWPPYAWIVVAATAGEMLWIGGAAAFGTTSHFNVASPVMAAIYGLMGALAVTLTTASAVYGVLIWRNARAALSDGMRAALGLGLVLTLPLTLITAGYMSSQTGHYVGTPLTGVSLPLMGWSGEVGDLRAPHFFATHALHVVPLAALALRGSVRMAWLIGAGYALFTLATFVQAVAGRPFFPL